jgi:excisionase family DNA binding protein
MKKYYTVKEVSRLLSLSTNTIYKYLAEGKLASRRFGRGRFKILASSVAPFLNIPEDVKEDFSYSDNNSLKDTSTDLSKPLNENNQTPVFTEILNPSLQVSNQQNTIPQNPEPQTNSGLTPLNNQQINNQGTNQTSLVSNSRLENGKWGNMAQGFAAYAGLPPKENYHQVLVRPNQTLRHSSSYDSAQSMHDVFPQHNYPKALDIDDTEEIETQNHIVAHVKKDTTAKSDGSSFIRLFVALTLGGLGILYLIQTPLAFTQASFMHDELAKLLFTLLPYLLITFSLSCFLHLLGVFSISRPVDIVIHILSTIVTVYFAVISIIAGNYGLFVYISGFLALAIFHLLKGNNPDSFMSLFSKYYLVIALLGGIIVIFLPSFTPFVDLNKILDQHKGISAFVWYISTLPPLLYFLVPGKKNKIASATFFVFWGIIAVGLANQLLSWSYYDVAYICFIIGLFSLILAYNELTQTVVDHRKMQIIAISCAWAAVTLLFGIFAVDVAELKSQKSIKELMSASLNRTINQINTNLEQNRSTLISYASSDDAKEVVRTSNREKAAELSKEIFGKVENLSRVIIFTNSGTGIGVYPYNSLAEGVDYSSRDYFKTTKATYHGMISPVYESILNTRSIMQTEPIFENNEMIGMIGIAYSLSEFGNRYQNSLGTQYHLKVVDQNDVYVYNPDNTKIGNKATENDRQNTNNLISISQYANTPVWYLTIEGDTHQLIQNYSNFNTVVTVIWVINAIFSVMAAIHISGKHQNEKKSEANVVFGGSPVIETI